MVEWSCFKTPDEWRNIQRKLIKLEFADSKIKNLPNVSRVSVDFSAPNGERDFLLEWDTDEAMLMFLLKWS